MRRRLLLCLALAATAIAVLAAPAAAGGGGERLRDRLNDDDRRISVSGGLVIGEDETVTGEVVSFDGDVSVLGTVRNDIFIARGDLTVDGTVRGDILVIRGNVTVADGGTVRGDIAVIDGRATVQDGGNVSGDVKSRKQPRVAPNSVTGDVEKINLTNAVNGIVIALLIALWIVTTISVLILGLLFIGLFPRAADAVDEGGQRFWASLGLGILVGIGLPVIATFIMATVVGIPFGLGIFAGLTILGPLGYVAASLRLGRLMVKSRTTGARFGAFFAGFGILRAAALIPGIGFIVWYVASLYGIGAIVIAAWRAGHAAGPAPAAPPADGAEPVEPSPEPAPAVDDAPKPEADADVPAGDPVEEPATADADETTETEAPAKT